LNPCGCGIRSIEGTLRVVLVPSKFGARLAGPETNIGGRSRPFLRLVQFGTFEVDLPAGELRKAGRKLKLTGQPYQVLAILLERPGQVVENHLPRDPSTSLRCSIPGVAGSGW
jgi:hypothetical protein